VASRSPAITRSGTTSPDTTFPAWLHRAGPGTRRPRQEQLQGGGEEPEGARPEGAPVTRVTQVSHNFRSTTAPTSTTPYMHTISGRWVGHRRATAEAEDRGEGPEPEMYVSRRMSRVKRNAITAGTTGAKTISTRDRTASVITTPKDR